MPCENGLDDWRLRPMYTVAQTARLAGISTATVKRWLYGYQRADAQMRPVFGEKDRPREDYAEISFLQLIEVVIAGRFRARGVSLERIRRAHEYARNYFNTGYPFADVRLRTDGTHILHEFEEAEPGASLLALDQSGQLTLPKMVVSTLISIDFETDLAARWFPAGRDVPIVIDPRFGAGLPTIPERRLSISTIHKRWKSGQTIQFIAEDFELEPPVVERALQYAERLAA